MSGGRWRAFHPGIIDDWLVITIRPRTHCTSASGSRRAVPRICGHRADPGGHRFSQGHTNFRFSGGHDIGAGAPEVSRIAKMSAPDQHAKVGIQQAHLPDNFRSLFDIRAEDQAPGRLDASFLEGSWPQDVTIDRCKTFGASLANGVRFRSITVMSAPRSCKRRRTTRPTGPYPTRMQRIGSIACLDEVRRGVVRAAEEDARRTRR